MSTQFDAIHSGLPGDQYNIQEEAKHATWLILRVGGNSGGWRHGQEKGLPGLQVITLDSPHT